MRTSPRYHTDIKAIAPTKAHHLAGDWHRESFDSNYFLGSTWIFGSSWIDNLRASPQDLAAVHGFKDCNFWLQSIQPRRMEDGGWEGGGAKIEST